MSTLHRSCRYAFPMSGILLMWVLIGLVAVVAAVVVVLVLARRRSALPYDTYQPGVYNSMEEAPAGPASQRPLAGPGGTPIGFQ